MGAHILIGWREWLSLPELKITRIKAKVDTGARTSALHANNIGVFKEKNKHKVRFTLYSSIQALNCTTDLIDIRWITDSSGHKEQRCVIMTKAVLGSHHWPIEISLTSRSNMQFKMLLGRIALTHRFIIDPSQSYLLNHTHSTLT